MSALMALLGAGCLNLEPVTADEPCNEVSYAVARRTFECTGDNALANQRYLDFSGAHACKELDWHFEPDSGIIYTNAPGLAVDYFHCAFAVGELPCELVERYGDDYAQWLTASPVCELVIEEAQ